MKLTIRLLILALVSLSAFACANDAATSYSDDEVFEESIVVTTASKDANFKKSVGDLSNYPMLEPYTKQISETHVTDLCYVYVHADIPSSEYKVIQRCFKDEKQTRYDEAIVERVSTRTGKIMAMKQRKLWKMRQWCDTSVRMELASYYKPTEMDELLL